MINAENIIYTDASFRGFYGRIAVVNEHEKILLLQDYSNVCCIECLELEAMLIARHDYPQATIYADNIGAISRFLILYPDNTVIHVRGFMNKADRYSKCHKVPENGCKTFSTKHGTYSVKKVKVPRIVQINEREFKDGRKHFYLIKTPSGQEWVTGMKFKNYQKYLRKQNKK